MKIAIIGLGSIGRRHALNFSILGCEVRLYDQQSGIPVVTEGIALLYRTLEGALDGCDGAVICTPPESHVEIAWKALGAGCHLMIEKPVALQLDDLGHLFAACKTAGKTAMVAYPWRYDVSMQAKRARVPELGPVLSWSAWYSYDTPNDTAKRMGALFDCSHAIDFLRWMLGEPLSLSCYRRHGGLMVDLNISFKASGLGKAHLSLVEPLRCEWQIEGEDGAVDWKRERDAPDITAMYLAEAAHFLACIRGEATPLTDGWDARQTLMVCDAAQRSATEARWIAR